MSPSNDPATTRIIVDKAALEAGEPAIQVVRSFTSSIERRNWREVVIYDSYYNTPAAKVRQLDAPGQDGTRIEIEVYNEFTTR